MKIVAAPNAFKGSLTAREAASAMAAGIHAVVPDAEVALVPVADGGDGLVEVALDALQGERCKLLVTGPRFDLVESSFCHVPEQGFAAIEMALASGLALLPESQRDPTLTTTLGTGELILAALELGVVKIGVGIGGSATNDGGIGMAAALGVRFLNAAGEVVPPLGKNLLDITHIDMSGLDPRLAGVIIEAVCDVDNLLVGDQGAAAVYAPQKGATAEQVKILEAGLVNLAGVIKTDLGKDVACLPGGGAAGGLGAGLFAFVDAALRPGVDVVLDMVKLDKQLENADLVLTGEGQIDFQTVFGKAPAGVGLRAKAKNIPCIALAGSVGEDLGALHGNGIDAVFSLCSGPMSLQQAMDDAEVCIARSTEQIIRCFLAGRNLL